MNDELINAIKNLVILLVIAAILLLVLLYASGVVGGAYRSPLDIFNSA